MEIIIIILLVILIIISVISLSKNINEGDITERLGKIEITVVKELGEFKSDINRNLVEDFNSLNERIDHKMNLINDKVNERLDQNFEKTNKTFANVLERLSKIDEAQKKIDILSTDIVSLQSVLTDKKSRGTFGEVNLRNILVNIFGEANDAIYEMQYHFPGGEIADSIIKAPEPLGTIAIDSKFPLENYQRMMDKNLSGQDRLVAEKLFKQNIKKHIDDISSKYIIEGITTDQAILFLPAEAIFAEINAYHQDLLEYSYKKRVWITSPTTLMSSLTTIQMIIKNIERNKYTSIIHEELNKLSEEFGRYKLRWEKLTKSIDSVSKEVAEINITSDKITKRFDSINKVEIEKNDFIEE